MFAINDHDGGGMCEKIEIPSKYIKETTQYTVIGNFKSWQEAQETFKLFSGQWIFRGQRCQSWELVSSLWRCMRAIDPDSFEEFLVDIAKDSIHSGDLPKNELGWRAFIQHYGGKTRLLDFTTNPYIATFFAFALNQETDKESETECAVWSINRRWLEKKASQKIEQKLGYKIKDNNFSGIFETMLKTNKLFPMACPFVADWKDQRLINQESIFLCGCDPCATFEDNLFYDQVGNHYTETDINYEETVTYIKKILIPIDFRGHVIKSLEDKNINSKTMLPGMDKFQDMENIIKQAEIDAHKRREVFLEEMKRKRGRL